MAATPPRREPAGMALKSTSPRVLHQRDAIALPASGAHVMGRAARRDSYPIVVTMDREQTLAELVAMIAGSRAAVVTDSTVAELHGAWLLDGLAAAGIDAAVASIPPGEPSKTVAQAVEVLDWLTGTELARTDAIVTFGGGVVNDLGGWVASCYMRGVPYVNVPTTLIGQVDAGIGGKLAVNHQVAKNLIGGFFQPRGVISDVGFLDTLDVRHLRAGLAESVKKALIASPAYWGQIERDVDAILVGDHAALARLVHGASAIKAELIARDPYERDARRTLGFGHVIAHPLETVTGYQAVLHGEAVSFGMTVECRIARARGLLSADRLARVLALLGRAGLPVSTADLPVTVDGERLLEAVERVRLIRGGCHRFVLPIDVGETVIADDVTPGELRDALRESGVELA
jgi:3-dehydroquinate synthase